MKIRLGVNIDHVATIRNARAEHHPDPLLVAINALKFGANSITIHLREDRRHIKDQDLLELRKNSKIPINLEMALTDEMIRIADKINPEFICLVPEKRNEITTEGGLNLNNISYPRLKKLLKISQKKNIQVSAFINPTKKMITLAKILGFDTVEIHTGPLDKKIVKKNIINKINEMIEYAYSKKLTVNVGHGLNFNNIKYIKKRRYVDTVHVGHFIISEAIFISLINTIKTFRGLIKK